jgi:hypothetical protein
MVDHLADDTVGSGTNGSLRYCMTQATDGDRIQFGVTGTINLAEALPSLTHSISIDGPGANLLTVRPDDEHDTFRIFTVSYVRAEIAGLTIANGTVLDDDGGGIWNAGVLTISNTVISGNQAAGTCGDYNCNPAYGGGIFNVGTLAVSNSTVSGNSGGGAIFNARFATLTVSNSTISGNTGGIVNDSHGMLTVSSSTISGNSDSGIVDVGTATVNNSTISGNSGNPGGGIFNEGTLTVTNSTISGNPSGGIVNGGTVTVSNSTISGNSSGIYNSRVGTVTVSNSTISGNSGNPGGGIYNLGTLTVSNSTTSGNTAIGPQTAGGIANVGGNATVLVVNCTISNNTVTRSDRTGSQLYSGTFGTGMATIQFRNTIISGDGSRPNLFVGAGGTFISQGYNLSSDDGSGFLTGDGDFTNTDPMLGPLRDNGGPTKTMALLAGSPALNAGDPAQLGVADQRGVARCGGVNIGAYQASASAFVLTAPATVTAGVPFDVTVTAVDPFGQTALGYTGTVAFSTTDPDPGVVLPAAYTFTAGDNGTHTFSGGATLNTAGNQRITVRDTELDTLTVSLLITVA